MSTRVNHCGRCGYDLSGLTEIGQCPECGQYFDKKRGVGVRGNDPVEIADRWLRRTRTIVVAVVAVASLACAGGVTLLTRNARCLAAGILLFIVLVLATYTSYVYEKD